jgi:hypothetical protein
MDPYPDRFDNVKTQRSEIIMLEIILGRISATANIRFSQYEGKFLEHARVKVMTNLCQTGLPCTLVKRCKIIFKKIIIQHNTYTVCYGGGVWNHRRGGGHIHINTCRKVSLRGNFLDDDVLLWCLYS